MSMYDNGVVKMINFIYEDLVASGNYEDTREYSNTLEKVSSLVTDDQANNVVYECNYEASRQFFILGFLKAVEMFNIDIIHSNNERLFVNSWGYTYIIK